MEQGFITPTEGQELDALSQAWLDNEGKRYSPYFDNSPEAVGLGAKLFGWIKGNLGRDYTEDDSVFIPKAFVEALGDRAPDIVQSAITAARKEGWKIDDAGDAVERIKSYVSGHTGDVAAVKDGVRYTQQGKWSDKAVQRFVKELRESGGQVDRETYKWMKSQFSDPIALLLHFKKPSKFYKAEKHQELRGGLPKTQGDMDVDGETLEVSIDRDGDIVTESSEATAGITDNDGDWNSGVSEFDSEQEPSFIGNTKDGRPFDIQNEYHLKAKNEKLGAYANSHSTYAKEIGVWQRVKAAANGDKALLKEHEDALIRERGNYLSEADFAGEMNPDDLSDRERKHILGQINRRFRVIEVEKTASANDMAFDKKDVHMKDADPRDQNLGPSKGVLRFMRYNNDGSPIGRPFVTSTQMLLAKMFKSQDSLNSSTKWYEGTAQQILQHLSDGVTSLLQDESFGGADNPARVAFTVKDNGVPRWVRAKDMRSWPKNLRLFRDKQGNDYTLGEALEQEKLQSETTFSFDFDPDDVSAGRNDRVRDKTAWEKRNELKAILDEADKPTRAKIFQALKAKDEDGDVNHAPVEFLWNELVDSGALKSRDTVTEVGSTRGNQIEEGQVGPDDLSAYDPNYIKRDERGAMRSKNIEYEAQSVIGTSKKVDPKDAGKFGPALKPFPTLTSTEAQKFSAEKLQAAKDWGTGAMRNGVEPLIAAIGKMDLAQLRITDAALFGRETVTERKSRVSDPNVSVQKVDAAEVAALAIRVGVNEKVAESMLRRGDETVHTRVYDKDIGGFRTKDAGESQTVTKQIGLLDLNQTKLAKQYFNGSLRDALPFLKTGQENRSTIEAAMAKRKLELKQNEQRVHGQTDSGRTAPRGQADPAGTETGVVAQPRRERATENRELGASQQGRNAEDGGLIDGRLGRSRSGKRSGTG